MRKESDDHRVVIAIAGAPPWIAWVEYQRSLVDNGPGAIIHPYGDIGIAPFGAARADYARLAGGIRTYTEQITDADMVTTLQNEMDRAEAVVFLAHRCFVWVGCTTGGFRGLADWRIA